MIFFKKDPVLGVDLESAINNAVFPGLQVGWFLSFPNNDIAIVCILLLRYY